MQAANSRSQNRPSRITEIKFEENILGINTGAMITSQCNKVQGDLLTYSAGVEKGAKKRQRQDAGVTPAERPRRTRRN
ncbi:hypothetical protein XELAEV_18036334mg [Xenopus laevis]|uniref:Uncharacterized protein n=1 Tax=Xenopus laevis TaxID=8355 RepID=A0A974HCY0_XENLA|nr:hypothetical protein XELAEV_18036334mg [Xenopus laevis]